MAKQTETPIKGIPDTFVDNVAKYRFYDMQNEKRPNTFSSEMKKRYAAIIDAQLDEIAIINGIGLDDIEGKNRLIILAIHAD